MLLRLLILLGATLATLSGSGCTAVVKTRTPQNARDVTMMDGATGDRLSWAGMMARIANADVIVIGEQHDDPIAHAFQEALVNDVVQRWPGSALAMEMLERDEQAVVADYLEDIIDAEQFAQLTGSASWAGRGSWARWYQPVIDAAKHGDGGVIAANAPRRYVRLARIEGYERLRALPAARRAMFTIPDELLEGAYRERFFENAGGDPAESDPTLESFYRAQLLWDSTMAASVVTALQDGATRVVLLVGQFHSDFDGGTVQYIRRGAQDATVMTISVQRGASEELRADDVGRADVVVYAVR